MKIHFLILLLLIPLASSQMMITGSVIDEAIYGENIVRIQREAEVIWVRENFKIIHDTVGNENQPLSMLTDEQVIKMLRTYNTRRELGINEIDMDPYMERVRNKDTEIRIIKEKDIEKRKPVITERPALIVYEEEPQGRSLKKSFTIKKPNVEQPTTIKPTVKCIRKQLTFTPFTKFSLRLSSMSDNNLKVFKKFRGC